MITVLRQTRLRYAAESVEKSLEVAAEVEHGFRRIKKGVTGPDARIETANSLLLSWVWHRLDAKLHQSSVYSIRNKKLGKKAGHLESVGIMWCDDTIQSMDD